MANELKHKDIGTQLTKAEFEDVTLHQLDSQATGDLIKAISDTQLSRLPVGVNDKVLTVVSGVPAWADVPPGTLAEDTLESNLEADGASATVGSRDRADSIGAGADYTIATFNDTYDASSMAVGVGFLNGYAAYGSNIKFRLYMGGVQVAESGTLPNSHVNVVVIATKALSDLQTVYCALHNYSGAAYDFIRSAKVTGGIVPGAVAAGSIKLL